MEICLTTFGHFRLGYLLILIFAFLLCDTSLDTFCCLLPSPQMLYMCASIALSCIIAFFFAIMPVSDGS